MGFESLNCKIGLLSRPEGAFPWSAHHVVGFLDVTLDGYYIYCLELWMELCATLPGAGVRDLFPEGSEVFKSETALKESIWKWVSQSLKDPEGMQNFEKPKIFKSRSERSGAGISMLGV